MRQGVLGILLFVCGLVGVVAAPAGHGAVRSATNADSYFSVTMSGPSQMTVDPTAVPPIAYYDVTVSYVGPALHTGDAPVNATMTMNATGEEGKLGVIGNIEGNCSPEPPNSPTLSCDLSVDPGTPQPFTFSFQIRARGTGLNGDGAVSVTFSTGASASVTTAWQRAELPTTTAPAPTTTTTAPPASPAAPPTTVTQTVTPSTPPVTESATVAPAATTVSVGVTWPTPADSFDVTNIAIVNNSKVVARATQSVRKLIVVKTKTKTSVNVTIRNPVRGKLTFKLVPRKVTKTTRVKTTIRQTKKR